MTMRKVRLIDMPNVEGLTPNVLWTTIYGFIALCILVAVVLTAAEKIQFWKDRRARREQERNPRLADEISNKILEQLEPRFKDIEDKLKQDKNRLDNHESLLQDARKTSEEVRNGLRAYGKTMLVLLNHADLGQSREVVEATDALNAFLADQL